MSILSSKEVGTIENHSEQIFVKWAIDGFFSSIPENADTEITSPVFQFADADWSISIYPNGLTDDGSVGYIDIYLVRKVDLNDESIPVKFSFEIEYDEEYSRTGFNVFGADGLGVYGWSKFIERKKLHCMRQELVPGDTLTVACRASIASKAKYIHGNSSLSKHIQNIFHDKESCDAVINVKGKEFHVHKLILESRSPVLSAMFTHDMKEKISGTVNIDDCEPEIFNEFLLYLYSGNTENLSPSNAVCLYYLADKYNLQDLQDICADYLKYNLDLDNILKVVILAHRHNENELRDTTSKWFENNLQDVVETDQWIAFMAKNSVLAAELLRKALRSVI